MNYLFRENSTLASPALLIVSYPLVDVSALLSWGGICEAHTSFLCFLLWCKEGSVENMYGLTIICDLLQCNKWQNLSS